MDSNQIPPVQPVPSQPNPMMPPMPAPDMGAMRPQMPQVGQQMMPQQMPGQVTQPIAGAGPKKDSTGLIKTLVIVGLALLTVTFVGLFIWKQSQYTEARTDVDGQIAVAVQEAEAELTEKLEDEFAEREKYPYLTFTGPADYGQLTFQYPRTWSVYVAADASNGGDFMTYFNPGQVNTVGKATINALRLAVRDKDFDQVAAEYQKYLDNDKYNLTMQSITVANTAANLYTGDLPDTENFSGYVVIFKIRDKTAVLQTDSVLFNSDFFDIILDSVEFNA